MFGLCLVYVWLNVGLAWVYFRSMIGLTVYHLWLCWVYVMLCVGLLLVHVWFMFDRFRIGLDWIQFLVYSLGLILSLC